MKVGDKLMCKKDYCTDIYNKKYYFDKGNFYEICYIVDKFSYKILCIETDDNDVTFSCRKTDRLYVWNYFYKPEEIRKLKLESL